jgi:hypothetical protein
MYLPWVLSAFSNSAIEKRRSRETAGTLPYQSTNHGGRSLESADALLKPTLIVTCPVGGPASA